MRRNNHLQRRTWSVQAAAFGLRLPREGARARSVTPDPAAANPGRLWDLPDEAMIIPPARFFSSPHERYARNSEELRRLIRASLAPITDLPAWLQFFVDQVPHEAEHAAAAQKLGCTSRFTFWLTPNRQGSWDGGLRHDWISRRPVSKLAIAAIAAAPSWLSPGDLADLNLMGYQGSEDVADRIRAFNRRGRPRLPVPVSARRGPRLRRARSPVQP
jgi:hypothetical protein